MLSKAAWTNIIKAIITRLVVVCHIIFLYMTFLQREKEYGALTLLIFSGIGFIFIEGLYTILKRQGQDWKWGSPLLFIYITTAYIPCLTHSIIQEFYTPTVPCKEHHAISLISGTEALEAASLEIFFLVVIFTRWMLPKGKITLEELSKLLLIYISVIADILDMMKMVKNLRHSTCDNNLKERLFYVSLSSLAISTLQLCLGLTAKRRTKAVNQEVDLTKIKRKLKLSHYEDTIYEIESNSFGDNHNGPSSINTPSAIPTTPPPKRVIFIIRFCYAFQKTYLKVRKKIVQTFEKEVWGILVSVLIKDIPFSIIRTYAIIAADNCVLWNQSVFFTLKNYFTIIIQINRCYVLFTLNDDESKNCQNKVDDIAIISGSSKLQSNSDISLSPPTSSTSASTGSLLPQKNKTILNVDNLNQSSNSLNNQSPNSKMPKKTYQASYPFSSSWHNSSSKSSSAKKSNKINSKSHTSKKHSSSSSYMNEPSSTSSYHIQGPMFF